MEARSRCAMRIILNRRSARSRDEVNAIYLMGLPSQGRGSLILPLARNDLTATSGNEHGKVQPRPQPDLGVHRISRRAPPWRLRLPAARSRRRCLGRHLGSLAGHLCLPGPRSTCRPALVQSRGPIVLEETERKVMSISRRQSLLLSLLLFAPTAVHGQTCQYTSKQE